jgi:hypothetical protein
MVLYECTRCKKTIRKKPDKVPYVNRKPYCDNCYGIVLYFQRKQRNEEKRQQLNT